MKYIHTLCVAAVVAFGVVAAATASADNTRARCPADALLLPHGASTRAAGAARAQAAHWYPGVKTQGAKVVSAKLARNAGPRGVQVGLACGSRARARTVVVELRFPRMAPSASLSQGVVDVSRFKDGYRVWAVAH
jgi:hypothetical protein